MKEENNSPPFSHTCALWATKRRLLGHDFYGVPTWVDKESGLAVSARRLNRTPRSERQRCGAKCRDGHPCQAPTVWNPITNAPKNGRCKLHGGASTGPVTPRGKLICAEARIRGLETRRARAKSPPRKPRLMTCVQCAHFNLATYSCGLITKPWRRWKPSTTENFHPDEPHQCIDFCRSSCTESSVQAKATYSEAQNDREIHRFPKQSRRRL